MTRAPAPDAGGGSGGPDDPGFFDDAYHYLLAPFHPEAETRHEVASLRELLGLAQGDRILDLGCGWGRHLNLLRAAGHHVVGLDRSFALLRRARAEHVGGMGDVPPLAVGDMRWLPFRDGTFDVVINLATSLGLFRDDADAEASLVDAVRVLVPGGRLLVEGMHRDDVVAQYAARDRWTLADGTEVRVRRRFDALRGVSREVLRWRGPGGEGEKRHALRLRSATELARLLEAAGLELEASYGGWDGRRFRHDSERLIVVVARPSGTAPRPERREGRGPLP
jgi:SAM-dependent methyltransferase